MSSVHLSGEPRLSNQAALKNDAFPAALQLHYAYRNLVRHREPMPERSQHLQRS